MDEDDEDERGASKAAALGALAARADARGSAYDADGGARAARAAAGSKEAGAWPHRMSAAARCIALNRVQPPPALTFAPPLSREQTRTALAARSTRSS